jgi:hypothetical protein
LEILLLKLTGHTERVRKRAFSGSVIPDTLPETPEVDFFSEITNSNIVRACKRASSGQHTQADSLTRITKQRQTVLKKGDNVVIPIPTVDRGPTDPRNIKGFVTQVNDHGGYKVSTKVGLIKGYLGRNQIEFCESETVNALDVPESELSLRAVASKLSMSGGQRFFHCNCKNGSFKTSRCTCRKFKVLCNSRCHQSLSCTNK